MAMITITEREFSQFQRLIYDIAGIKMADSKKPLVSGRLAKRLAHYGVKSYGDYFRILQNDQSSTELQVAIDLLTTNETYFFRESKHFDFIKSQVLPNRDANRPFRVWSAACSSGEEAYTLAMVNTDVLGYNNWEILASDISSRMLEKAGKGHYTLASTRGMTQDYLSRYCLKGVGRQDGTFLIESKLRQRIKFMQVNLNESLPRIGEFDMIFLRNVMIYFDKETKSQVISRILSVLRPGGYLMVSHSESLHGMTDQLSIVKPSVYQKTYA